MNVSKLMQHDVKACNEHSVLHDAARLMWEHDFGAVPVTNDQGVVVGIVTDRDIAMAAYTQGRRISEIRVRDVMSGELHTCRPGDSLREAERIMKEGQVRRLPVIDGEKLVGMISLNDLALASREKGSEVTGTEVVEVLSAVSQHRHDLGGPVHAS